MRRAPSWRRFSAANASSTTVSAPDYRYGHGDMRVWRRGPLFVQWGRRVLNVQWRQAWSIHLIRHVARGVGEK
jgi:hypothetical protein